VALSCKPSLLLADEPTTALDASVQIQVLVLLRRLQKELGMSMIFVTHDLGVAAQIADKVAVMYAGRIVEYGNVHDVLMNPQHPYTRGMLSSTVKDQARDKPLDAIPGSPPDLRALPPGCSFAPRCRFAGPSCLVAMPEVVVDGDGHMARCVRVAVDNTELRLDDRVLAPA
jgi:peptide/nickel transport system ATP-binding protein